MLKSFSFCRFEGLALEEGLEYLILKNGAGDCVEKDVWQQWHKVQEMSVA